MSFTEDPNITYLQTKISSTLPICLSKNSVTGHDLIDLSTPPKATLFENIYIVDKYRNHGQNLMLKSALGGTTKELRGENAKEFARVFQKQTLTLAGIAKTLAQKKREIPTCLPEPLKEPEFRSFPGANGKKRKITGAEAALAAEADKLLHEQKSKKALELKEKYEAELVALEASRTSALSFHESLLPPGSQSSSQQPRQVPDSPMNISTSPSSADSESDNLSGASPKIHKSGRARKLTKRAES